MMCGLCVCAWWQSAGLSHASCLTVISWVHWPPASGSAFGPVSSSIYSLSWSQFSLGIPLHVCLWYLLCLGPGFLLPVFKSLLSDADIECHPLHSMGGRTLPGPGRRAWPRGFPRMVGTWGEWKIFSFLSKNQHQLKLCTKQIYF